MYFQKLNVVHAQPFLCVKSSPFFKVKCRAFSFRKMFYMAGTFFWSNILASPTSNPLRKITKNYLKFVRLKFLHCNCTGIQTNTNTKNMIGADLDPPINFGSVLPVLRGLRNLRYKHEPYLASKLP